MHRRHNTTKIPLALQTAIGVSGEQRKRKKAGMTRKERRKAERAQKKQRRAAADQRSQPKSGRGEDARRDAGGGARRARDGPKAGRRAAERSSRAAPMTEMEAEILREEQEIAEMEEKLGLTGKDKDSAKQRLRMEYEEIGLGGGFADFLDDLDNLSKAIKAQKRKSKGGSAAGEDDDDDGDGDSEDDGAFQWAAADEDDDDADDEIVIKKNRKVAPGAAEEDRRLLEAYAMLPDDLPEGYESPEEDLSQFHDDEDADDDAEDSDGAGSRALENSTKNAGSSRPGFTPSDVFNGNMKGFSFMDGPYGRGYYHNSIAQDIQEAEESGDDAPAPPSDAAGAAHGGSSDSGSDSDSSSSSGSGSGSDSGGESDGDSGSDSDSDRDGGGPIDAADSESEASSEGEEDADDAQDEEERKRDFYAPSSGEDIYGRQTSGKYVPPSLKRKLEAMAPSGARQEQLRGLKREVTRLLNRMGESTLTPTLKGCSALFSSYASGDCVDVLVDAMLRSAEGGGQLQKSVMPIYGALAAGLHVLRGASWSGPLLEELLVRLSKRIAACRTRASGAEDGAVKEAGNLVLLLSGLFQFGVCTADLYFDFVKCLLGEVAPLHAGPSAAPRGGGIAESDVELLLLVMQRSGAELRQADPASLAEISRMAELRCDAAKTSARVAFMLETLQRLVRGKKRRADAEDSDKDRARRFKKWLGAVKSGSAGAGLVAHASQTALHVRWADVAAADEKGRWWVGGKWAGHGGGESARGAQEETSGAAKREQELLAIASTQRLVSDARRRIFVAIMSSASAEDAYEGIAKLDLRGKEQRDVPRVVLECCANEKGYNPFYASLAERLCQDRQMRYTFCLALRDRMRDTMEEDVARRAVNLGRLCAHLISRDSVTLSAVFTGVDGIAAAENAFAIFLAVCFDAVIKACAPEKLKALAQRGDAELMAELAIFVKKYLTQRLQLVLLAPAKGGREARQIGDQDWRRRRKIFLRYLSDPHRDEEV